MILQSTRPVATTGPTMFAPTTAPIITGSTLMRSTTGGGSRGGIDAAGTTPTSDSTLRAYFVNKYYVSSSVATQAVSRMRALGYPMTIEGAKKFATDYIQSTGGTSIPEVDQLVSNVTGETTITQATGFDVVTPSENFLQRNKKWLIPTAIGVAVLGGRYIYLRSQK